MLRAKIGQALFLWMLFMVDEGQVAGPAFLHFGTRDEKKLFFEFNLLKLHGR
jgi:hypothetical protein